MDPTVRVATAADVPAAADTLRAAFRDYPFTRHTIGADDHERRLLDNQTLFLSEIGIPHGRVWVAGAADGPSEPDAVAVWTTPASTGIGDVFARLAPRLAELAGDRAAVAADTEAALAPHRPTGPVWFLATVGVRPGRQGRGLGSAVLRPGLAEADRTGSVAYLETSLPGNVRLYRRLGFEVEAELDLPHGGPRTWTMARPPG
ncbi:Acetyltransferase (GNAT) family protein [Pseudonocardia ammonioxydans]|uniref:Acetyltransferase (GNAT) family protein n=1 Tax=Pseudonocardia ammonioxydans TaxID=260086 RepID=A0A1I4RVT0_PSUAM|nr:GNAT family N-acetyltransferase [Pseudonocardia ammonioxydans]SFM56365.1 Acetyltransferase (GNAT) family protein [Pseudonocardia ammonioxydans]